MKDNVNATMESLDNTKKCDPYYVYAVQFL